MKEFIDRLLTDRRLWATVGALMRKPTLKVVPYRHSVTHPWCIEGHRLPGGKRKRLFFRTQDDANRELLKLKTRLDNEGRAALVMPDDLRVAAVKCAERLHPYGRTITEAVDYFIAHLDRTARSCTVAELVESMLVAKRQDGKSRAYLRDLTHRVNRFATDFGARNLADIGQRELDDWLRALPLGPKSRNNFRANIGVLFSYGVDRGYIATNPIERAGRAKLVDKAPEIFTVDELAGLLACADADTLPAFAIGAFAGLRPDEVGRLHWGEVNLTRGLIEVKSRNAKTARRRLVKIEPNLAQWLAPYAGRTGRVVPPNARKKAEAAREAAGLTKWPYDGLRHSFGSYHVAHFGDAARTAMEMGHADQRMLFAAYREVVAPEDAAQYWNLTPEAAANVVAMGKAA